MRYDDEHLSELLRALPPAPVHVVTAAKELFAHFPGEPDEAAQEEDSEGHDDLPGDDTTATYEPESDSFDGPDDSHEPDGADWN